jgi:hypothetical protein
VTVNAGFEKTDMSCLGLKCAYRSLVEDSVYAALLKEMVSINHLNLIKIVRSVFQKIAVLCL